MTSFVLLIIFLSSVYAASFVDDILECSTFNEGYHFNDVFQTMGTLGETKEDSIGVYCRKALGAIVIARSAMPALKPHDIYESFQALSILHLPDPNRRSIQILKSVIQKQWDALERKSLVKIPERFDAHFKEQNRNMDIYLPPPYVQRVSMPIPKELSQLKSSSSVKCAIAAWDSFNKYLSYASQELCKAYTKPIYPTQSSQIVEERLSQIEDNILLSWTVDHMHSWGNVTSTLHYAEYLRHLILAQGDIHSSALCANHWQRLKTIYYPFQRGELFMQ